MSKQNLTRIVGIWWVLSLLSLTLVTLAQDIPLEPNTPISATIGDAPSWFSYAGSAGETIRISTLTAITDTAPDTTLEILYPDGHRLAYADDTLLSDGTIKSDATLQAILPIDGDYRIRLDSFNGVSAGEVDIVLIDIENSPEIIEDDNRTIVTGVILRGGKFSYTMAVAAGETFTLSARDVSGTLDPVIYVEDTNGKPLAMNDDYINHDLSFDALDAHIPTLTAESDTQWIIEIRDYLGRSGTVELIISS